jgi:predicted phosphodiesterase
MYLLDEVIECKSRSDRIEIFPFFDCHIGKRNCAEGAIKKQIAEIIRRSRLPNRHVRVLLGGDQLNAINPADIRRFDFNELADFFVDSDAKTTRERLGDIVNQEVKRAAGVFDPVKHLIIGALTGNHEKSMKTKQNVNVHGALCTKLGIRDLTDEAAIRIITLRGASTQMTKIYLRHGYGGGRTAGAEPMKIDRMVAEWEDFDVCLTGHSHTFCISPPKPILYIPGGKLPKHLPTRYRFGANPGCWLLSHMEGVGSYESAACYPARPMMTLKIVIWPFWSTKRSGDRIERPKIELRQYPIL